MTIINAGAAGQPATPRRAEVLYESERTRISRVWRPRRAESLIRKDPLGPGALARAHHEHRVLERLATVPGVVRLAVGCGADELLLEDEHGEPLTTRVREEQPDIGQVVAFALALAEIVGSMHRAGVMHGDINPANVLVAGSEGRPLLIDFELASTFTELHPTFTHQRNIVGTLPYLAPEQTGRTGMSVDERADLYGIGSTVYELATGQPPFAVGEPLQMIRDALVRVPIAPADLDVRIPRQLSDIIMRLLEKQPEHRYQSAEGLAHDVSLLRTALAPGRHEPFALGERDFPLRLTAPSQLVGRATEIVALRTAFDGAMGSGGRGVLVAGAPGVGKTALVNELRSIVTERGGWFVTGKFDQYRPDAESGALGQALRALGRLLLAGSDSEVATTRARIAAQLGSNVELLAIVPEFAALLRVEADQDQPTGVGDGTLTVIRTHQAWLALLRAVASPERPVVIAIDDLQWAGGISIGFIDAVLTDERLAGVLLVGTYRAGEVDATHPLATALTRWERLGAAPVRMRLENLPRADLGALLGEMLRLPPAKAAGLADAVGARSGGNPFDTVELLNALRRDGALVPGETGWRWDADTIRRFVGEGDVVDLLAHRIDQLPRSSQELLETMACLGGEMELDILRTAAGLGTAAELDELLGPALEDGLLVREHGAAPTVRFRHDRVQQAAHGRLDPVRLPARQLAIARRLAPVPHCGVLAAGQYLRSGVALDAAASGEKILVAGLFVAAAVATRLLSPASAEQYLTAAIALLDAVDANADDAVRVSADRHLHTVLYNLGRLVEADEVYARIERSAAEPTDLVEPACIQLASLTNRGRPREAVTLGLRLLGRLGVEVPADGGFGAEASRRYDDLAHWAGRLTLADDRIRPEIGEATVRLSATLVNGLQTPALFCDPSITCWLLVASQRMWIEHGPSAPLVASLSSAIVGTLLLRNDYRTGYAVSRHILGVGEARGYEPATSYARQHFAHLARHWFEPLEGVIDEAQRAREGLIQGGVMHVACYTYFTSIAALLDCSLSLDSAAAEVASALSFAARTGNDHAAAGYLGPRQLLRALRGETNAPGSFNDADFDEGRHLHERATDPMVAFDFHLHRALSAALFGDTPNLIHHAAAAVPLLPYLTGFYISALAHLLHGLATAEQVRTAGPAEQPAILLDLDSHRDWLSARAADAPGNFGHLATLLDAERAWAVGDPLGAIRAFDAARGEVADRQRPWHRALITERAALCHLDSGLEQTGRDLLAEAKALYAGWGATGKVRHLNETYPHLQAPERRKRSSSGSRPAPATNTLSAADIDMHAVLRASQALSSETSLERLRARIGELLGAMTGASTVLLALRTENTDDWELWDTTGSSAAGTAITDTTAGLLPISAFRYAERTGLPLLVADAVRDDRFARDPYLNGLERCSLLIVPIRSQGAARGMLVLGNTLLAGAFTADRLDAVLLVTGQLAVSLDNARLYASLEHKVDERTVALAEANRALEVLSNTDALTALPNRRHFDATLATEWERALRQGTPLGLAMIDVDQFKAYNDHYGHQAGDECLRRVATAMRAALRDSMDVVCRYGGEEFALILPGAAQPTCERIAERVRAAVETLREPHHANPAGIVTISVGVAAQTRTTPSTAEDLIANADLGLYDAKNHGRNQVRSGKRHPAELA